jgi:hypothetical protein
MAVFVFMGRSPSSGWGHGGFVRTAQGSQHLSKSRLAGSCSSAVTAAGFSFDARMAAEGLLDHLQAFGEQGRVAVVKLDARGRCPACPKADGVSNQKGDRAS